jgi:hypothetical protein
MNTDVCGRGARYAAPPRDQAARGHNKAVRRETQGRELFGGRCAGLEQAARPRPESPAPQDEPRLIEVSKTDLGARDTDSSTAMRVLAVALIPHLLELFSAQRGDEHLVDVCAAVPGPRRTIMAACRRGDISGAVRVGRRWLAPRTGIDAWLRARGPRVVPAPGGEDDDLESVRRSLAMPGRRRYRA